MYVGGSHFTGARKQGRARMHGPTSRAETRERFDPTPVLDWLDGEGYRVADDSAFLGGFADRVVSAGLPVDRLTTGIPILHPQILSHSYLWTPQGGISLRTYPASAETIRKMEASPLRAAYYEGRDLRCPIGPEPRPGEYPILTELRAEGYTDYASFVMRFSDGSPKAVTVATRHPAGFVDADLDSFARLLTRLAPLVEVRALKMVSRALLDTYIGQIAGGRVLKGEIRRGEGEVIQSVIWFSDLRNSTDLAATLSGPEMIAHLNEFFSIVTGAVADQGGEVLKFIGDSVLAIFPCESIEQTGCMAADAAETAARRAMAGVAARNAVASTDGRRPIEFGIALHVGEVFYGNVGGDSRLDFTVIGPAVNLAARIEGACKETQRPLLASEAFATISNSEFSQVGAFRFGGVPGWTRVYAPSQP